MVHPRKSDASGRAGRTVHFPCSFRVTGDTSGTQNILPYVCDPRDEAKRRQEALVISQDVTQAHWIPWIPVRTWRRYLGGMACFDVGAIVGNPGEGGRVGLVV